jgi:predicted transcriptional regulator
MATITLKLRDEIAQQFREFALKETGSMRGLSRVAEKALSEYMDNHRDEIKRQSLISAN